MPSRSTASALTSGTLALLASLMTACGGGSGGGANPTTQVVVQLTSGGMTYLVDRVEVSIQKAGGAVLTGVTDANGVARISVPEMGIYSLVKMAGVDAASLPEGGEGREFVKPAPLVDPYPSLTYTPATAPTATVSQFGQDYPVNFPVPSFIQKVRVLKVGHLTATGGAAGLLQVGTGPFAGRVVVSNLLTSDAHAGLVFRGSNADENRLILYANQTGLSPALPSAAFYGGPLPQTSTDLGSLSSYMQTGPISFEAPGTNGGEWALGCASSLTEVKTRNGLGGPSATRDLVSLDGGTGVGDNVLQLFSTAGGIATYSLDYRIFSFEAY